ncbi:M20 family metallo-hydrolase [Sporomusa termitida]|uniref:Putative hydrolase n=1 Tax=Sporomusa termitida TaxID=2377 RepID=A0A517DNL4_9FIRM|nr:M20 family metallo-hydrolase [Sporomusa termitida]QDR78961.1 putative hydrolase [Sporomusa termitida]
MVSSKRLQANLHKFAAIGATREGGITRLAYSDADWQARSLAIQLMEQAGLQVRCDAAGNLIGRREGRNPAAPPVMAGSHIDSVPNGGNFDGLVGVLGAIEAVQVLSEAGIRTEHPIEVVVFAAEESSRFGLATVGSKAFAGTLPAGALQLRDKAGITLADAMRSRGLSPAAIGEARYSSPIKAFLELHIEQGKVLEKANSLIGIVTGIAAPTRIRASISGQADHSGATPMNLRQDALAAGAELILLVEQLAWAEMAWGTVGTTGIVKAEPGVMNVIPGQVELGIDIRSISQDSKQRLVDKLGREIEKMQVRRGVAVKLEIVGNEEPVQLPAEMVSRLQGICGELQLDCMTMPSGAGHDAMHLAKMAPTGMIFIPCRGGISHNPAEWAEPGDITAGTEVLLAAIRQLAEAGPL